MWAGLAFDLLFDKYKSEHPDLDEEELYDSFYEHHISPHFLWGDYANLELTFNEKFEIIGGKIF